MKNIAIIADSFYPYSGAGSRRITSLCRYLIKAGYTVYLFTIPVSYVRDKMIDQDLDDLFDSDHFFLIRTGNELLLKKDYHSRYHPLSLIRQIFVKIFFWDRSLDWALLSYRSINKITVQANIKVLFSSAPGYSTHWLAMKIKEKDQKIKWIMDYRDPWLNNTHFNKLNTFQRKQASKIEKEYFLKADKVTIVTKYLKNRYADKYNRNDIVVLHNGYDEYRSGKAVTLKGRNRSDKFVIGYTGSVYDKQEKALSGFILALNQVIKQCDVYKNSIYFKYAGSLNKNAVRKIQNEMGNNFTYEGRVSLIKSLSIQNESDMLLLLVGDKWELTSKVFEYISAGKFILCIMNEINEELAEIIKKSGAGECFQLRDKKNIMLCIEKVYKTGNYKVRNSDYIREYNYENITGKLVEMIERKR